MVPVTLGVELWPEPAERQRRLAHPLVDMSLFRSRAFDGALAVLLLGMATIGGIYLFVTQYLQLVEGLSPIGAGLWLLPPALALVASSMLTPTIARRVRPSYVVAGGLTVSTAGFVVLTQVSGSSGLSLLVAGFLLVYAGIAPLVVLGTDLVVGGVPPDKAGSAAAISQTGTELGVALGIAILGSVGSAVYRAQMSGVIPTDAPADAAAAARDSLAGAAAVAERLPADVAARLMDAAGEAFAQGLGTVAVVVAVVVAGLAVAAAVLLRHVGSTAHAQSNETAGTGSDPDERPETPPQRQLMAAE